MCNRANETSASASQSQINASQSILEIFNKYRFVYCWVESDSIKGNHNQFAFNFRLWLRSQQNFTSFDIRFKTLKKLLTYVCEQQIYFLTQRFPCTSIKRDSLLQQSLDFMDTMMTISNNVEYIDENNQYYLCKGPRAKHWWSSKLIDATDKDMDAMAYTLTKLLNSPMLVIKEDKLFTAFNIHSPNDENHALFVNKLQQKLTYAAHSILSTFKLYTCPKWPLIFGLSSNMILDATKNIQQNEFEWVLEETKENLNTPCCIVELDSQSTVISRFRIQGTMDTFQIEKWEKKTNEWVDCKEYKMDDTGTCDIRLYMKTRKVKIIPFGDDQSHQTSTFSMKLEIFGPLRNNHKLLFSEKLKDIKFQQLYVAAHDGNINDSHLTSHWAIKLEGYTHLLTLEWLAINRVKLTIEENTCIGQRRFWYSWYNDKKHLFTQRWGKLYMLPIVRSEAEIAQYHLEAISAGCIAFLIDSWISKNGKYDVMENNCQHFVADLLSLFSKHGAEYLNTKMDHVRVNTAINPLLEACDVKCGDLRLQEIRQILLVTFQEYQDKEILKRDEYHRQRAFKIVEESKEVYEWLENECGLEQYYKLFVEKGLDSLKFIQEFVNEESFETIFGDTFKLVHKMMILKKAKEI